MIQNQNPSQNGTKKFNLFFNILIFPHPPQKKEYAT
jgi:hypothetical protein